MSAMRAHVLFCKVWMLALLFICCSGDVINCDVCVGQFQVLCNVINLVECDKISFLSMMDAMLMLYRFSINGCVVNAIHVIQFISLKTNLSKQGSIICYRDS
jgi:hypothetical protein